MANISTEERYFLEVLHHRNWPDNLRLIYADFLEEHGEYEQGREQRELVLRMLIHARRYRTARRLPPPLPRRPAKSR